MFERIGRAYRRLKEKRRRRLKHPNEKIPFDLECPLCHHPYGRHIYNKGLRPWCPVPDLNACGIPFQWKGKFKETRRIDGSKLFVSERAFNMIKSYLHTYRAKVFLLAGERTRVDDVIPLDACGGCSDMPEINSEEIARGLTEISRMDRNPVGYGIIRRGYETDSGTAYEYNKDKWARKFPGINIIHATGNDRFVAKKHFMGPLYRRVPIRVI